MPLIVPGIITGSILAFIARFARELSIPILYVSHSLDEILNLADHLILLNDGKVVTAGSIETLMSRLNIRQLMRCFEYGTVFAATVEEHHREGGITALKFLGGILNVPLFFDIVQN